MADGERTKNKQTQTTTQQHARSSSFSYSSSSFFLFLFLLLLLLFLPLLLASSARYFAFDGAIDLAVFPAGAIKCCSELIGLLVGHFKAQMQAVVENLQGWVPENWAALKDQLLDSSGDGQAMAKLMVANDSYPKLAPAADALQKLIAFLGKTNDPQASSEVLGGAKKVMIHSVQCAYYTYLCYMLLDHIPSKVQTAVLKELPDGRGPPSPPPLPPPP